jgi:hypothetical protein
MPICLSQPAGEAKHRSLFRLGRGFLFFVQRRGYSVCHQGSILPRAKRAPRFRPHRRHPGCATGEGHPAMGPTRPSATPQECRRPRSRSGRARDRAPRWSGTAAHRGGEWRNPVRGAAELRAFAKAYGARGIKNARTSRARSARDVRTCWRCGSNASDHGSQVMIPSRVVAAAWLPKPA